MVKCNVFCIGETVLDIIFRDDEPIAAKPGGSMLNAAVSLGRAGVSVSFISDFGNDHAGEIIHDFLVSNGVSTEFISRYSDGKTALSLAFLDERQHADYSFYKIYPLERLTASLPMVNSGDIVLFGSFYALTESIHPRLRMFIRRARENGAFIMYDPNFRREHLDKLDTLMPMILDNISLSDLVRGSDEDFMHIFAATDAREAFQYVVDAGCSTLIYTRNSKGVEVLTGSFRQSFSVPEIQPLSTIGAGDAFNAGIIYGLLTPSGSPTPSGLETLTGWETLTGCIESGIQFSTDVCQSLDNYISIEFGNKLKRINFSG